MMFALLVLTLVSFCFVGFTFARYTSSGNGTATATIAKWSVTGTFAGEADAAIDMKNISPSMNEYNGTSYVADNARKNTSKSIQVLTIKNESDVDALVKVTATISIVEPSPAGVTDKMSAENILKHFTVTLYKADGTQITEDAIRLAAKASDSEAAQLVVSAKITWTSDLNETVFGAAADAEDTYIGQYLDVLTVTINYTAVQGSQLPNA